MLFSLTIYSQVITASDRAESISVPIRARERDAGVDRVSCGSKHDVEEFDDDDDDEDEVDCGLL